MWTLKTLFDFCNSNLAEINSKRVPARPIPFRGLWGFKLRLKDAWAVVMGKADAFIWPENQ